MFNSGFTCGHCGRDVSKETRVCPHCRALLSGIKCRACGFVGSESNFVGDRCPKCRSQVTISRDIPSPEESTKECPKCGWICDDILCEHCGRTDWGVVFGLGFFGIITFASAFYPPFILLTRATNTMPVVIIMVIMMVVALFGTISLSLWLKIIRILIQRRKILQSLYAMNAQEKAMEKKPIKQIPTNAEISSPDKNTIELNQRLAKTNGLETNMVKGTNPFIFRNGQKAYTVKDLIRLCLQSPVDATYHLVDGHFESWLTYIGRNDLANVARNARETSDSNEIRLKLFLDAIQYSETVYG